MTVPHTVRYSEIRMIAWWFGALLAVGGVAAVPMSPASGTAPASASATSAASSQAASSATSATSHPVRIGDVACCTASVSLPTAQRPGPARQAP